MSRIIRWMTSPQVEPLTAEEMTLVLINAGIIPIIPPNEGAIVRRMYDVRQDGIEKQGRGQ